MTKITIYDDDDKRIGELANAYDVSEAHIISALLQIIDENEISIEDYV